MYLTLILLPQHDESKTERAELATICQHSSVSYCYVKRLLQRSVRGVIVGWRGQ